LVNPYKDNAASANDAISVRVSSPQARLVLGLMGEAVIGGDHQRLKKYSVQFI
jgi:hypothetical protein